MPNYTKPLWIVIDPKGRPLKYADGDPFITATKRDAIGYARDTKDWTLTGIISWRMMQDQGYRCVKARLEWEGDPS